MPKGKDLFDSEGEEEDNFKINENYAERYDKWRSKEEYEKLKARASTIEDSDSSSSEDEDDGKTLGKAFNPKFDREFLRSLGTLYSLREKDSKTIENVKFFQDDYRVEKDEKEKVMTLKDLENKVLFKNEGVYEESKPIDDEETLANSSKKIKLEDGLEESDDDDDLLTSGLFKKKEKTAKNENVDVSEAPRNTTIDYIKGVSKSLPDSEQQDVLDNLKGAWNSGNLSKKDKWLLNFFLNERYLEGSSDDEGLGDDDLLNEEEISDDDDDEAQKKKNDPLAPKYKYRHQEPGDFIKMHPRNFVGSVRPKDERRIQIHASAKERLLKKKEEKREEIEFLKSMKLKEIQEKIEKIKEASGNEDIDIGKVNLDEDFDPATHDANMEQFFGDNYYTNVEEALPDFEFEDKIEDAKMFDAWKEPTNDDEDGHSDAGNAIKKEENVEDGVGAAANQPEYYDGEDFIMDADYDPEVAQEAKKKTRVTRRKKRHTSKVSKALQKKKPVFDPNEKDFSSYFDEYYQLDFEDVVAGIPCRFKYRKVEPNNYGLTTEEILSAETNDLNRWVGVKKLLQYNMSKENEIRERQKYADRAEHLHIKQKILPSLFVENPEELAEMNREKKRLKNLKRKQKRWKRREGLLENAEEGSNNEVQNHSEETKDSEKVADLESENPEKMKNCKDGENVSDIDTEEAPKKKKNIDVTISDKSPKKKKKKRDDDANDSCITEAAKDNSSVLASKPKKKKLNKNGLMNKKHKKMANSPPSDRLEKVLHKTVTSSKASKVKKSGVRKNKNVEKMLARVKKNKIKSYLDGVSDKRLEAYGQDPKKVKKKVLHGKRRQ